MKKALKTDEIWRSGGLCPHGAGAVCRVSGSPGLDDETASGPSSSAIVDGSIGDFSAGCSTRFFTAVGSWSTCCACPQFGGEDRWKAVCKVSRELGLEMDADLIVNLEIDDPSPQSGYPYAKQLLARKKPFTALFAYNDISAIGAIRAIQEKPLRVPQDISVVGFDDIPWAAFHTPSLTTVRQPLDKMGQMAAETLIRMIEDGGNYSSEIAIEPTLVVRESTAQAPQR
jgi:Periplasmic binding protein-like domain